MRRTYISNKIHDCSKEGNKPEMRQNLAQRMSHTFNTQCDKYERKVVYDDSWKKGMDVSEDSDDNDAQVETEVEPEIESDDDSEVAVEDYPIVNEVETSMGKMKLRSNEPCETKEEFLGQLVDVAEWMANMKQHGRRHMLHNTVIFIDDFEITVKFPSK